MTPFLAFVVDYDMNLYLRYGAYGQVDFVGDVRGNVHARISAFGCDVDVSLAAFNDCINGDGSIVNIQIKPLGIVEIVDAEAKSAIEGLAVASVCHSKWEGRSHVIVSRDTDRSPGLVPSIVSFYMLQELYSLGVALAADANLRGMPELEHHAIFRLTLVDPSMTYSAPVDTPLERSQKGILIRAEL
jgi:hypothetical protein